MKQKSKHAQLKRKKEIRFKSIELKNNKNKQLRMRHPAYVFLERGNIYIYVSITHSSNIKGLIVIELSKNPNPNDKRKTYWVAEIREDTKDKFGRRKEKWKINERDDKRIRDFFKKQKNDDPVNQD